MGPEVALGRDTTLMRAILDKTAGRVSKDLTNQPEVAAQLQSIIANTYLRLSVFDKAERERTRGAATEQTGWR